MLSLRKCRTQTTRRYRIFATPVMKIEMAKSGITELTDQRVKAPAPLWATLAATVFGIGRLKPGPGTWASAAAVLVWFVLARWIATAWQPGVLAVLAVLAIAIGIPAATSVARASGGKDPQLVVIDEVAGQWITLLFAPVAWKTMLAGFILFRAFDIVKPPPVRQLEGLPEGTGIVMDDVAAGIYALAVLQLLIHFGVFGKGL
jgi:phosphatidylglycerophosphatase A